MILNADNFQHYVNEFNKHDEEIYAQHVPNASAWAFLRDNIPLFECPDVDMEEIYYFRWWTYRKHIKETPDGFVITEFLPSVPWAGKHNAIVCPAGHHYYEGRWLHTRKYLDDYSMFWLRKGGALRKYSTWLADAIWQYCTVSGRFELAVELLPNLVENYREWEGSNGHSTGMFWSNDDRDGMEFSISGSGLRPTLNSYMYADAVAIKRTAEKAGERETAARFHNKAQQLKVLVNKQLWDSEAEFFKVIPLPSKEESIGNWSFASLDPSISVRESLGYVPWCFNIPDAGREAAWEQLMDPKGFYAPYGPTTAEQRHPRFMFEHRHECLWNGPSWPFATSQVLTAMANLLNHYSQDYVGKEDYLELLSIYTKSHRLRKPDGSVVPWIDENLHPFNGQWLARSILEERHPGGGKIRERGKDYNHSTYCDLIITGLVGLRPQEDDRIVVNPLVPQGLWDYFCLDRVPYHGRNITILYDRTGSRYGKGKGLRVLADGQELSVSDKIMAITV